MKLFHFILFLFLILSDNLFAQKNNLLPPIKYHLQSQNEIQQLSKLEWILEEGQQPLTPQLLQAGKIKDAKILNTDNDGFFKIKIHQPYWIKLQLSSDAAINNWHLWLEQKGAFGPFSYTFSNVDAYFFKNGKLIKEGKSGYKTPNSQRDVKSIFTKSLLQINLNKDTTEV